MPPRPLKDKDKYYPGSPFGDRPPEDIVARRLPPGTELVGQVGLQGLRGQIVEARAAAGDVLVLPSDAGRHVDAYFEYTQLVGDSDGGHLMPEAEYEALRARAADPARRVWAHWVESNSGLECKAMGPSSMCFCGHRYREHTWDEYPETHRLVCKMSGCRCPAFSYVPVRGSGDVKCSVCKQSYLDHNHTTRRCLKVKGGVFASSYACSCNSTYDAHATVVQTNAERKAAGKLTNTAWMDAAGAAGLPTAHMGGISGFTALADGVDRALAGLEPGFEPHRVYDALAADRPGVQSLRQPPAGRCLPPSAERHPSHGPRRR